MLKASNLIQTLSRLLCSFGGKPLLPPSTSESFDSWVLKMKRTQDEWHFICWAHRGQSGFYIYRRRDHLYPVLASAREAGMGDIFPLKGSSITSNHQSVTIGNNCLPLLRWQFYTPPKNVPAFIRKAFRWKSNININYLVEPSIQNNNLVLYSVVKRLEP